MATVKEKESAAPVPMYKKLHNAIGIPIAEVRIKSPQACFV